MSRNPRWNPVAGDCFFKGKPKGILERTVVAVHDGRIDFTAKGKKHTTTLARWREWSADANLKNGK